MTSKGVSEGTPGRFSPGISGGNSKRTHEKICGLISEELYGTFLWKKS